MPRSEIDWDSLAIRIGSVDPEYPYSVIGGTAQAQKALVEIIGLDAIYAAVDRYVYGGGAGAQVAGDVLGFLRPTAAIDRCWNLVVENEDDDVRRWAAVLLGAIDNGNNLERVRYLLNDPDLHGVGAGMLARLVVDDFVEPSATVGELVNIMLETKSVLSDNLREHAEYIIDFVKRNYQEELDDPKDGADVADFWNTLHKSL